MSTTTTALLLIAFHDSIYDITTKDNRVRVGFSPALPTRSQRLSKNKSLVSALIASIFAGLISSTLKPLFDLARPTDILNISSYHLIGVKISGHSFPSGHTLSAFAVASSLIFFYKKSFVTVTMFLLASLVGLSRIMLGVHWPIDVLMGATLGLACAYLGVQLALHPWLRLKEHKLKSSVVNMLYLLLSLKLFLTGTGYASVQGMVQVIAILGIGLGIALIFYQLRKKS